MCLRGGASGICSFVVEIGDEVETERWLRTLVSVLCICGRWVMVNEMERVWVYRNTLLSGLWNKDLGVR